MALEAAEIGNIGEKHAGAYLQAKGYSTNVNTKLPGSTDIEADGILVQVKTAIYPSEPADLSGDELRNIKTRASKTNRVAWQAKVQIDKEGNLVGDIKWSKL